MTSRTKRHLLNGTMGVLLLFLLAYSINFFDDPGCEGGYCTEYYFTHLLPLLFIWLVTLLGQNLWLNRNHYCLAVLVVAGLFTWPLIKADWVTEALNVPFKVMAALQLTFLLTWLGRK